MHDRARGAPTAAAPHQPNEKKHVCAEPFTFMGCATPAVDTSTERRGRRGHGTACEESARSSGDQCGEAEARGLSNSTRYLILSTNPRPADLSGAMFPLP